MSSNRTVTHDGLSPRQVADAIGVSESSLKRWCDKGLIAMTSTPGGHRRLQLHSVMEFVRTRQQVLEMPEALGLPADVGRTRHCWDLAEERFREALKEGREHEARHVIVDTFVRGHSSSEIADRLFSRALNWLGEQWECGELEVYRERRSCRICISLVHELMTMLPPPPADAPVAIGATPAGDFYEVPTALTRLVLRELGWQATSLGSSLPHTTLLAALRDLRPQLFWLSVSHLADESLFRRELEELTQLAAEVGCQVIGGGREFPADIDLPQFRKFNNLQSMADFVRELSQSRPRNSS